MENMSILNLFNFTNTVEVTSASVQTPVQQGEFENVFKKYLDRSQQPEAKDTAANQQQQESVQAEEPETPEEVIDNLDIPDDQKAELKRMLEEAETPEDVSEVLDELIAMMQEQGAELEDVEEALTDIAKTILSEQETRTEKDSMLLEASLDKIVAVQAQQTQNTPQLSVVKTDQTQSAASTEGDTSGKESRREALMNMVEKNSDQLPADVKEKIVELASKVNEKSQINDTENGFNMKTDMTEKVIRTEIRIESPKDIMKFAELVELAKSQKANRLEIQLHPQELGKVNIQLTEQAGKITGKVVFESESARHLFASNAESFKQQLAEKGIVVENLEFLFKDMDQHEFAGWEGREGKKGGSNTGGMTGSGTDEETESEDTDGIYA